MTFPWIMAPAEEERRGKITTSPSLSSRLALVGMACLLSPHSTAVVFPPFSPPLPPFFRIYIYREKKGVLRNAVSTEEKFDNFSDENNVEDRGNYTGIIGFLLFS